MADLPSAKLVTRLEEIVRRAGAVAMELRSQLQVRRKEDGTVVTQADLAIEKLLFEELMALTPHAKFLGEERAWPEISDGDEVWIVDPIDGTDAYRHGLAYFGVSVALVRGGRLELAAFHNPFLGEMFLARRDQGATNNGGAMQVRRTDEIDENDFVLGPSDFHRYYRLDLPVKIRSLGSTAEHLALVADGRASCAFGYASIWDIAAGVLLVREAGGLFRFLDGAEYDIIEHLHTQRMRRPFLAAAPQLWRRFADRIDWLVKGK
jgi:myo-inositol-1(or 4)-monophosphatase